MTRFLSQLTRFSFLCHFWPWNELSRLQRQCHAHWEFGESCRNYLNLVRPGVRHYRFDDHLFCVGAGYCNRVEHLPQSPSGWRKGDFDA